MGSTPNLLMRTKYISLQRKDIAFSLPQKTTPLPISPSSEAWTRYVGRQVSLNHTHHLQDLFDAVPDTLNPNVTGWLVYDAAKPLPDPALIDEFDPFDDFTLVPEDGEKLLENPDYSFNLDMKMDNLGDGAN